MLPKYKPSRVIDNEATALAATKARKRTTVSQTALADEMGVRSSFLSALEHGTRPWSEEWAKKFMAGLSRLSR